MNRGAQLIVHLGRGLFGAIFSFVLWTFWLALVVLLIFQLYILSANELPIPDFARRQIEVKLAESGLRASFGRSSFDPTGRVLVDDLKVSLRTAPEPVVTVRSAYLHLNPLALVVGKFEPSEVRITGAAVIIPASLSQTGQPEEIITGVEATVEWEKELLTLRQLNARVAGVITTARGSIPLPRTMDKPAPTALADIVAHRFPAWCRQASAWSQDLARHVEAPSLQLELGPSESGALNIEVTVLARSLKVEKPVAASATQLRATTRLLLFGDRSPSHIEVSAAEVQVGPEAKAHTVNAMVVGQLQPGSGRFDLREIMLTADSLAVADGNARSLSALLYPRPLPRLSAAIVSRVLDEPLALQAETDLNAQTAAVKFTGSISPTVLDLISKRVGVPVRKFYDFDALTVERGEARFGAKWNFEHLAARVHIPRMNSAGVIMEDGRATVELEPGRFYSPDAFARVGPNYARGTYEHNLKTHEYRFLLRGRLHPLAISPWFREWWPNFFNQLEFEAPPEASVDVSGGWRDSRHTSVFVFADTAKAVIRGTEFDRVRTRLFIRPAFFDGLEVLATRGERNAHGRFTFIAEPVTNEWRTLDLALDSNLELKVATQLLGPAGQKILAPFQLAAPPELKIRGNFAGPAAPAGSKDKLRIEVRTTGEFRFHHFPVSDASFVTTLDGDDIVIDDLEALFAGGVAGGHARVWGTGADRRLGFDIAVQDATLGQVAAKVSEFFAAQKGEAAPPPGKFVQEKANVKLQIAASAEGLYNNPLSYRGDGNAALQGAEIGEVPLLGTLSELLKFTALRFTEARANFKIEGPKLAFTKVELRGANSAIDAHGDYALDRRTLDFNAKIFPFQESENLIKSVVGAVLTPLSNAFEVRLTGSLAKPEWAFVIGPTNLLRNLGEGGDAGGKPATAGIPPSPVPKPAPEK